MTHTLTATEKINQLIDENVLLKQWAYCAWVTLAKGIEIMDLDQISQWQGVRFVQETTPLSEEDIQIFNENPPDFDMDALHDIQHPFKPETPESEGIQQATPLEAELLVWIKNAAGQMRYVADMLEEAEMMNQWPGYNQIMDRCPVVLPDHHGRVCADCGKPAEMTFEEQPICYHCNFRAALSVSESAQKIPHVASPAESAKLTAVAIPMRTISSDTEEQPNGLPDELKKDMIRKGRQFWNFDNPQKVADYIRYQLERNSGEQHDRTELSDGNILMFIPATNAGHPFAKLIASLKDERDKLKG